MLRNLLLRTRLTRPNFSPIRYLSSSDTHSDFEPKKKTPKDTDNSSLEAFLQNAVDSHDVLLFMKGSPNAPQCGFSAKVAGILKKEGVDFSSADVLSSMEVREGIKKFSNWPTIPQLYVKGEFIGGCDIITEMHESNELEELLKPIVENQKNKPKE
eukprot:snap_masked-scaffold_23-processed-gene-4.11-mRNA-1 protein AED:0.40 eAED:0.40 QI:0/-1/0/1/-1/1/1/0/155